MDDTPTLVFLPGSWHKPSCYDKVIKPLQDDHNIKCVAVALPSTSGDPNATFKDDIDAARDAIRAETTKNRNVIVIAHSFGGMVGNSAIKGFTHPNDATDTSSQTFGGGYVVALVLIASGFTMTGWAFMDPLFGTTPPSWPWRANKETGFADIIANPREMFYHDLPEDEANYWVSQLTTQSLKSLFEGGEYAYAGWQDVPTWYIGTIEDQGLPILVQRVQVGAARALGAAVHHTELQSSHSPFLSMPDEVVNTIMGAVTTVQAQTKGDNQLDERKKAKAYKVPMVRRGAPVTWISYGFPLLIGHVIGWSIAGFLGLRRFWTRR